MTQQRPCTSFGMKTKKEQTNLQLWKYTVVLAGKYFISSNSMCFTSEAEDRLQFRTHVSYSLKGNSVFRIKILRFGGDNTNESITLFSRNLISEYGISQCYERNN